MELKNIVDFIYSLKNMDEVKGGNFFLPKEITFSLEESLHNKIHKQVLKEKNVNTDDLNNDFEVLILDINIKFEVKNNI
jgi:hypothetical protein